MSSNRSSILEGIRQKVSEFPIGPGVYFFKDARGTVLYVGKAKNLRSRVASYFQPSADLRATRGPEIQRLVDRLVEDVDCLECDSDVDALLQETRLIKDVQPRFNERLKDDKTFPYLQATTGEDFPRVAITREPQARRGTLYGPFTSVHELRAALPLVQRVFKFRTCHLDIAEGDEGRRYYRPCILYNIKQCTAPCAARVSKEDYAEQIRLFKQFLSSKGSRIRKELESKMREAASKLAYEQAARYRDELRALEGLQKRGLVGEHPQPEAFFVDPTEGLERLGNVLGTDALPRTIEGIDVAHLAGGESCGAMVTFIDGRPFKDGYRRYKLKTVEGGDDFAAIREVVWRRYKYAGMNAELFPDIVLIDGGRGQLSAAYSAFDEMEFAPPMLIALAKQEEVVYVHGCDEPIRMSRRNPALRVLQSVRDEAHRFAQHYHHILRRRATLERDRPVRNRRASRKQEGR